MPRPPITNPWGLWALDTFERALRAYAASFATLVGADQVFTKFDLALAEMFYAAFVGFLVSALLSLAGKTRGAEDSASFLPAHQGPPQP